MWLSVDPIEAFPNSATFKSIVFNNKQLKVKGFLESIFLTLKNL